MSGRMESMDALGCRCHGLLRGRIGLGPRVAPSRRVARVARTGRGQDAPAEPAQERHSPDLGAGRSAGAHLRPVPALGAVLVECRVVHGRVRWHARPWHDGRHHRLAAANSRAHVLLRHEPVAPARRTGGGGPPSTHHLTDLFAGSHRLGGQWHPDLQPGQQSRRDLGVDR